MRITRVADRLLVGEGPLVGASAAAAGSKGPLSGARSRGERGRRRSAHRNGADERDTFTHHEDDEDEEEPGSYGPRGRKKGP